MDRYVLDRRPDDVSVLHRNPLEACRIALLLNAIDIDGDTANALAAMPDTRPCEHCIGMPDPED